MDLNKVISELLDVVGGSKNIKNYEHCATRLRMVLYDDSVVDKNEAEKIEGLQGYFYSTGQHQFVFGTGRVNDVYTALSEFLAENNIETPNSGVKEDAYSNMNWGQRVVRILADILVPLIPVLVTTGLLMGVRGLLVELGVTLDENWSALFAVLTDTAFAFLPVFITYSATKKFGGNPILGIAVGLMLVAPQLPNAYSVASGEAQPLNILGVDIVGYQGSIFPGIIAGWLISWFEKKIRKHVPEVMDLVVTPFLTIVLTIAIMFFGLGPIISAIENFVIDGIVKVINAPLGIGYAIIGGLQQLLVVTGLHHSLSIIEISLINETGRNVLNTLFTVSMAGQFGAAIATATLMKDKVKRTNMVSSAIPTLFGITEPLLFGVNLRSMHILLSGVAGGAVAGILVYFLDLSGTGMGITFIPGLLLYIDSISNLIKYLLVIVVAFLVSFVLVRIQRKAILEDIDPAEEEELVLTDSFEVKIDQPLKGGVIELSQVDDPVFSSGAMGQGLAVKPTDGKVYAPFDGVISLVSETKHAIGIVSDEGVELLIHVGLDTVELNGLPFVSHVNAGDKVKRGELILEADLEEIESFDKDTITPIIITNSNEMSEIKFDDGFIRVVK